MAGQGVEDGEVKVCGEPATSGLVPRDVGQARGSCKCRHLRNKVMRGEMNKSWAIFRFGYDSTKAYNVQLTDLPVSLLILIVIFTTFVAV